MVDKLGELTRSYWPVVVGAIAVAVAWGGTTAQIASLAKGQEATLAKLDRLSEGVAALNGGAQYNTQDIADLRSRVNALEGRRFP